MQIPSPIEAEAIIPGRIPYQACPLCESVRLESVGRFDCTHHVLYKPELPAHIQWVRCTECLHVFTDGYFNARALRVLFSDTNANQEPGAGAEQNRWLWAKLVAKIAAFKSGGIWLDVGFGNGSLLFTADEWGFGTYGLDLRASSVEKMSAFGFQADCKSMAEIEEPGHFDIISMCDALEHMPFPGQELEQAHRLLSKDGLLVLSMPNMDCTVWKILDAQTLNPYWAELEHYHNFSRRRLYALLDQHGFEPLAYGVSDRYRLSMEVIARKV